MASHNSKTSSSLYLGMFLLLTNVIPALTDCDTMVEKYFYIKHKDSGLYITNYRRDIVARPYDSGSSGTYNQQWKIVPVARIGLFEIQVRSTMAVVGFYGDQYNLTITDELDSVYQQWFFNNDGSIVNGGLYNHAITVNVTDFDNEAPAHLTPLKGVNAYGQTFQFLDPPTVYKMHAHE